MSDTPEKKNDHPIFVNVVSTVLASVILLVCTTIYNLVLAHIWPVTIHFGEYSLNNFIFIAVSIVSSLLLAVVILSLEIYYVFNSFIRAINNIGTPREKRRKRQWFERVLEAFLRPALVMAHAVILQHIVAKLFFRDKNIQQRTKETLTLNVKTSRCFTILLRTLT